LTVVRREAMMSWSYDQLWRAHMMPQILAETRASLKAAPHAA
jgi:hypothetical protein